uniref:RIKEN cDNA 1700012B09 gene n=1 Tax=Peromyscus maniculatus bairdii TaxID=230844 RepID=A0A8C8TIV7_PERMB
MRRQEALVVTAGTAAEAGRDGEQPRPTGLGCRARIEPGGPQEPRQQWKTFLYCEPHKRIKEVLEEELSIKRDECHVKSPPAVALDGIWSIKRNLPVGGMIPGQQSRNSSLPQAKYYSRIRTHPSTEMELRSPNVQ